MSTISAFKSIGNKHDVYRGKDSLKKFFKFLREHAIEKINFRKKKINSWPNEQEKSYENPKICYICKEKFEDEKIVELGTIVVIQGI